MSIGSAVAKLRSARETVVRIAADWQARGWDTSPLTEPLVHIQEAISDLEKNEAAPLLLRLDLDRIRKNLEQSVGGAQTDDDVLRLLAGMRVWRQDEDWFLADETAAGGFRHGEVREKRPRR
jgi:hypothetical protein